MIINGTNVFIDQNYTPDIVTSIKWNQTSDLNYRGSDRTSSQDIYRTNITIIAPYDSISAVSNLLQSNRGTFVITLSSGEEIFGPHINYSTSLSATAKTYGKITRNNFKMYSLDLILQGIGLSTNPNIDDSSITTSLSNIKHVESSTTDRSFEISKLESYSSSFSYLDHSSDIGLCEITIRSFSNPISASPLAQVVKALVSSTRGSSFLFPTSWGEARPFGPRSPGPWTCKCIKWELEGRTSNNYWEMKMTLAEVL